MNKEQGISKVARENDQCYRITKQISKYTTLKKKKKAFHSSPHI